MLFTITTTHVPAIDLGYLLYKHPGRVQTFDLSCGQTHVFYPEADSERCMAALLLDLDPLGLACHHPTPDGHNFGLPPSVNDRPYVASSFLSVALAEVFGMALSGRYQARPELAVTPMALQARLTITPCAGGEALLRPLFEPLGYRVAVAPHPLDTHMPAWGTSDYCTVTMTGTVHLCDLLSLAYVLLPVLDDAKYYWIVDDEVAEEIMPDSRCVKSPFGSCLFRLSHDSLPHSPRRSLVPPMATCEEFKKSYKRISNP